jgi:hypothetical protein
MNFQPKSEVELTAVNLLKQQQHNKKITDKIEGLRLNSLIILIFPLLLSLLQFVMRSYGIETEMVFYGSLVFILLLIIWVNERIELLYKLILNKTEENQ